jgi:hypothetical protein
MCLEEIEDYSNDDAYRHHPARDRDRENGNGYT